MSEKSANLEKNKPTNKVIKWFIGIFIVLILEGLALGGSYLLDESRTKSQTQKLDSFISLIDEQNIRIKHLEQIPSSVAVLSSNIAQNNGSLKLLEENFNTLKDEVGNKKIDKITEKLESVYKRMERVEENKSIESLILSVALIIKENAVYGRNYAFEASILEKMAKEQKDLEESISYIVKLENKPILPDDVLLNRFLVIAKDFSFEKKEQNQNKKTEKDGTVSKSIKMIKETVAGINFDKVVIVKKDDKTDEQKELLAKLEESVKLYHFDNALDFINTNPTFFNAENPLFNQWVEDVKTKVSFDKAISKIISSELNAIKEEINNQNPDNQTDENKTSI